MGNVIAIRSEQAHHGKMVPGSTLDDPPEMLSIAGSFDGTREGKQS